MLGMEPGTRSCNVPGIDVGYMPQVQFAQCLVLSEISCIFSTDFN